MFHVVRHSRCKNAVKADALLMISAQGIGTVIETVESTLGAPSPEELAQHDAEKQKIEPNADDATDASHGTAPEPGLCERFLVP